MGYGNGKIPNNGKNGILEWNGPEQWKIWKSGMERSRTMENLEIGNGAVPNSEKMGYGNGRILNNGEMGYGNGRIPKNWKKWDTGIERSRTLENMEIWDGIVPNNEKMGINNGRVPNNKKKNGIRGWNDPGHRKM